MHSTVGGGELFDGEVDLSDAIIIICKSLGVQSDSW